MIGLLAAIIVQAWQPGAPMPTPGYGFACAAVGPRVFAIGGLRAETDSGVPRFDVEAYDVAADSWIRGFAPLPRPRWFAGCAELGGRIYIIGGTDGRADLARVDRFDPATNAWDTVASLPGPRSALAACTFRGQIYAIGGFVGGGPGQYQRTVTRFTPDSGLGRWEAVESLVTPRTGLGAAVADDRVCAVGGRFYNDLPTFESYQPGGWTEDPRRMHSPRSGVAAAGWGRWLCAIGGMDQRSALTSVEVVDMERGGWLEVATLSEPHVFAGAAIAHGLVVVIGGKDARGGATPSVERSDSTLFPAGIEEALPAPAQPAPTWATVAAGRARIDCRSAVIYDGSGRRLLSADGPVDAPLAPGVYFVRAVGADGRPVSGRITIVR